jgi:hypothetical protein
MEMYGQMYATTNGFSGCPWRGETIYSCSEAQLGKECKLIPAIIIAYYSYNIIGQDTSFNDGIFLMEGAEPPKFLFTNLI